MFGQLPPLRSIRTFEAAARLLSFKAAAQELHVSPTAVSHQIRTLEERLQVKLFERQTRAVVLTPDGEQLARIAHQMLRALSDTINEITCRDVPLTIGTTTAFAAMWLVPHLAEFRSLHPNLDVRVKADDQPVDMTSPHQVDLVIRYGLMPEHDPTASLLFRESLQCYATPAYWQSIASPEAMPATVMGTRWKNPALPPVYDERKLQNLFPKHPITIREFDEENQIIQAALASQGIALVSPLLIETPLANGWLVPMPHEPAMSATAPTLPGLEYYLITPERSRAHPAANQYTAWLNGKLSENA
ncbi:LysR substrate-binding domain-containing protein [Photobacterium sp. MCCC 1A19761]|uniref:LysR substrate-binding domain-containing protein n=1 Tax=Photobacterium sp. MCCC 1A19761 TaxID=3115000 RepID=UPI00307DAB81